MNHELAEASSAAAIKVSPAIAVVGATAAGYSLQDWVMVLTGAYIILQAGYLLWKWHREWKAKRK